MEWLVRPELPTGGSFKVVDLDEEPELIWTLLLQFDKTKPPKLPIAPVHHENAFMEDRVHDWMWRAGKLRYYTRVMDRSCWVLLEMKS